MKHGRVLLMLCAVLFVLAGCGKQSPTVPQEGVTEAMEPLTGVTSVAEADVQGKALQKDGEVYGFELRMRQTDEADALLRSPENFYYGVLTVGQKTFFVPTEEIRIVPDSGSRDLIVTILVPDDARLSGAECAVSLCVAPADEQPQTVLYCVTKTVSLP